MRILRDTRVRRKLLLSVYSLLLVAALTAILLISDLLLMSKTNLSDKLAEVADVIAGGTAVLGVLAGLVALQAYAAATGLPNLEVQVWFSQSAKNVPVFLAREVSAGVLETTNPLQQTTAMISLRNKSTYSARNPVVIVKISPITSDVSQDASFGKEWILFQFPGDSLDSKEMEILWEGGGETIIHGHASRRLPDLRLGTLSHDRSWQPPKMRIEIISDGGYRRNIDLPLLFINVRDPEANVRSEHDAVRDWL